jgi:kynurenine formamidase
MTDAAGIRRLFAEVSNWGRWGPDDELGTLNFLSPAKTIEAAALVEQGRVVSLAHDIAMERTDKNRFPATHMMLYMSDDPVTVADQITVVPHSYTVTHVDAITHGIFDGAVYNGRQVSEVVTRTGLEYGSVHAQAGGLVTRGVLLDIAASRGVEWLAAGEAVTPVDLDAAAKTAGLEVGEGDCVIVRVGLEAREMVEGQEDTSVRAGLTPECLRWFHERDIAIYGGDCFDVLPGVAPEYPWAFHQVGLAAMGLALLDNVAVEELSQVCRTENRWQFMMCVAPLRIPRATGSAVNPLAIF